MGLCWQPVVLIAHLIAGTKTLSLFAFFVPFLLNAGPMYITGKNSCMTGHVVDRRSSAGFWLFICCQKERSDTGGFGGRFGIRHSSSMASFDRDEGPNASINHRILFESVDIASENFLVCLTIAQLFLNLRIHFSGYIKLFFLHFELRFVSFHLINLKTTCKD